MSRTDVVGPIRGFDAEHARIVAKAEYALALRYWMRAARAWREYRIYSPIELLVALEHAEQAAQSYGGEPQTTLQPVATTVRAAARKLQAAPVPREMEDAVCLLGEALETLGRQLAAREHA
jgi:hypothetical protein